MRDFSIQKKYAIFTFILCGIISLLGLLTPLIPRSGSIYPMNITESEKRFWLYSGLISLLLSILPTIASLIGFYIYGAIGNSKKAKNFIGCLVFSLALSIALISIFFLGNLTDAFNGLMLFRSNEFQYPIILFSLNTFIQIVVFPILFTLLALHTKTVSLWKRFLPLMSLVLSIATPIFFAIIGAYTYKYLGSFGQIFYNIASEATIPQWIMMGAIFWGLVGLVELNKK